MKKLFDTAEELIAILRELRVAEEWLDIGAKADYLEILVRGQRLLALSPDEEFVVWLEPSTWLAEWPGDPGRTTRIESAIRYKSMDAAEAGLSRARCRRPFNNARIEKAPAPPLDTGCSRNAHPDDCNCLGAPEE